MNLNANLNAKTIPVAVLSLGLIGLGMSLFSTTAFAVAVNAPATTSTPIPGVATLTPDFVLQKAVKDSPELHEIQLNEEASEQEVGVKRANYFPTLDFQALDSSGFPGSSGYLGVGGLMGSPFRSGPSAGLISKFTVYDFGRTGNRVEEAKSLLEVTRANSQLSLQAVKQEVLLHLIECAHFQSLKRNWGEIAQESAVIQREVDRFVKTGQNSVVDRYLVETQTEDAKTQSADYSNRAKDELTSIQDLTGNLEGRECPFVDDLVFNDSMPTGGQPILKKYQAQYQVAQNRLDTVRSDLYPEIVALGSVGALEKARLVNKQDYAVAIGLEFPIFEGFKTSHAIHEARALSDSQQLGVAAVEQGVSVANHEFDLSIHSAQLRLSHLGQELDVAKTAVDVARKRYFGFEGKVIDLREAIRDLSQIENQISDARRDLESSIVKKLSFNGQI
jgi:outer membrane protein